MSSQEAYAILEGSTLTFKYGTKPNVNDTWNIPKPGDTSIPGWISKCFNITKVVFDATFSYARPQTCRWWFVNCENLTQIENMRNLNTSETTDMYQMFYNCNKLESIDLNNFATYNSRNLCGMFSHCENLISLDLSTFNTIYAEDIRDMFSSCTNLSNIKFGDLFNTAKITDMSGMFAFCSNLKRLDLSKFKTSKVESMNSMFRDCISLHSIELSSFSTNKVSDMSRLFQGCIELKRIDIHNFDISSLTSTYAMFMDCTNLQKIICDGDWSGVSESTDMFSGCTSLIGAVSYNPSNVTAAYANKTTGYFSPFYYYIAERSGDGKTLTFRSSTTAPNGTTQWDATRSGYEEINTNSNPDDDDYEPDYTFHGLGVTKVVFDESFKDARPNSCYCWFVDNTELTDIEGLEYLNTSEVTNMKFMFYHCSKLVSLDLRNFDVSNTETMQQMFSQCSNLKYLDLRNFDMTNTEDLTDMFYQCSNLETIVCNNDWNTSQVHYSAQLFWACNKLKGAISYNSTKTDVNYANPTNGYFTNTNNVDETPIPDNKKCATPIIKVNSGLVNLSCETEGVTFKTSVTYNSNNENMVGNKLILSSNITCNLSVYATKEGYEDSDVATTEITLRVGAAGDVNADGEIDIADAVKIVNFIVGKVNALSRTREENFPEPQ